MPTYVKGVTAVALGYGHRLALMADNTAPETTLLSGPAAQNSNVATFQFSGNDDLLIHPQALRFECSINNGAFAACSNPATFTSLPSGNLTLTVHAKDAAGNVDATPATYTWTHCGDPLMQL